MTDIHQETINMTPQISPKDIPQERSESEEEEEPVYENIVQESSSSGEDDDEEEGQIDSSPQGYIPLSMNDTSETSGAFLQEEENVASESHENQDAQMNEFHGNEAAARLSDSQNNDSNKELPMDNDQVNLIQQVMSKISLPPSSIPEWANVIPEDKWKDSLLTSLQKRTNPSSSNYHNNEEPEK